MVIEWLKFRVAPQAREKFIQADEEIWTAALRQVSGFLGKEIWIDPNVPEEIVIVNLWASKQQWESAPADLLEATEGRFAQRMGSDRYEMLATEEYQVRKFPTNH